MPTTLSIKNAPDAVVDRLRQRASRNHRSLQGELMAIIENAARDEDRPLGDPMAVLERVRAMGLGSASDSVEIIRAMRDAR